MLENIAQYISQGNNTFCLYNPNPAHGSKGYAYNYFQWETAILTVTYEEGVSVPTLSVDTVDMGGSVTIYTNRRSTNHTHYIEMLFGNLIEAIGEDVGDSVTWSPGLYLANQVPNATSGVCQITCTTYSGDVEVGTSYVYLIINVPASVVPAIQAVSYSEEVTGLNEQFGAFVQSKSKLSVKVTASGARGSTIASYRTTLMGSTYSGSSFSTGTLGTAGNSTMTITVTDSRGRTVTATRTISVIAYSAPKIVSFSAARCNSGGTAIQSDGTRAWINLSVTGSSVGSKNYLDCYVYYKLKDTTNWTLATTLSHSNYAISKTNYALPVTISFDTLSSYDLMVTVTDYFNSVASTTSLGTKAVILDILADGTGVAFGKVADKSNAVEIAETMAFYAGGKNLAGGGSTEGMLPLSGGTLTGNLTIQGSQRSALYLKPTYNGTTNQGVFEGSYVGSAAFGTWNDSSGSDRRMIEVRNSSYFADLDWAAVLRVCESDSWTSYKMFHSGMETPIPLANGGTGASTASAARSNLGCNNASNLTTGTVAMGRLPFKIAYGSTTINGNSYTYIDYSDAGFTSVPTVQLTYSTTGVNWSGDGGALKVYYKTATGCQIIVGGSFSSNRAVDWLAIGI